MSITGTISVMPETMRPTQQEFLLKLLGNVAAVSIKDASCVEMMAKDSAKEYHCVFPANTKRKFAFIDYELAKNVKFYAIKVQSRAQRQGNVTEVMLQIACNPDIEEDLLDLQLLVSVPLLGNGDDVKMVSSPNANWHGPRKLLLWKVDKISGGQKMRFQAKFQEVHIDITDAVPCVLAISTQVKFVSNCIISKLQVCVAPVSGTSSPVSLLSVIPRHQAHYVIT